MALASGINVGQDARRMFAPSADRNKEPILKVLKKHLPSKGAVLEVASGTGQHSAYFSSNLSPNLTWQVFVCLIDTAREHRYLHMSESKRRQFILNICFIMAVAWQTSVWGQTFVNVLICWLPLCGNVPICIMKTLASMSLLTVQPIPKFEISSWRVVDKGVCTWCAADRNCRESRTHGSSATGSSYLGTNRDAPV